MKNFTSKIFSLLIVTVMVSSIGCNHGAANEENSIEIKQEGISTEQEGRIPMGTYLTKEIDLPSGTESYIAQDEVGKIYCYDIDKDCTVYAFNTEGDWKKQRQVTLPSQIRRIYKIFSINDKMQIIFGNKKGEMCIAKEKAQNNFEVLTLTKKSQSIRENVNAAYTFALDTSQNIYTSMGMGQGKIQKYNSENGEWVKEYLGDVSHFMIMDQKIYGVSKEDNIINVYDCDTGEIEKTIRYNGTSTVKLFKGLNEGGLYACNDQGIMHLSGEDALWEQVVMPDRLKKDNRNVRDYDIYPYGTSFLIYYDRDGSNLLENCYYEKDCATIPSRTVNIDMFFENEQIRKAVEIYQKQHKDILINVNSAIKGNRHLHEYEIRSEELPTSDADLIVLDENIDDYIQDGNLADITDLVEQLIKEDILNEKITSSIKKDNKYYAIPLNYARPMIWGNKDIINQINTLEDLATYKQQHPEQVLLGETKLELFNQFRDVCFPNWFNESGEFDEKSYRSFLESITILEEEKYDNLNSANYCYNIGLNNENKKAELVELAKGKSQLVLVGISSLNQLIEINDMLKVRDDIVSKDIIGQGAKGIYYAGGIMGINAYSQNQDIVKEIIKIALSEQVQKVGCEQHLSVNHRVLDTQIEAGMQIEQNKALYGQFKEWNDQIETCIETYDYKVDTIINKETVEYCMGKQTIEDTIKYTKNGIKQAKEDNLDSSWHYRKESNLNGYWYD